jgi:hypothetical protein
MPRCRGDHTECGRGDYDVRGQNGWRVARNEMGGKEKSCLQMLLRFTASTTT